MQHLVRKLYKFAFKLFIHLTRHRVGKKKSSGNRAGDSDGVIKMRTSIVIRTLNEAEHLDDLLKMIARQITLGMDVETVLIDSGSTDGTVEIAQARGARITTISKSEFSFGRSLNRGCDFSTGDFLVFISGHCVPVGDHWLQNLCQPLMNGAVDYTYGRQIGDDTSNYSERRILAKYFPEISRVPQDGGAGRIARYAPDGRYLSQIGLPAPHASCPAFGGAQMTERFATTAMEGIAAPTAQDGQVFCCMLPHQGQTKPAVRLG